MKQVMRIVIGLVGLFNLSIGLGFLFQPARLGRIFFLAPTSIQGLATMRADFTAFFCLASLCALYGAWKMRAAPLQVPIALLGIALTGRFVSIAMDGIISTTAMPMVAEAVMIAILLLGHRAFQAKT